MNEEMVSVIDAATELGKGKQTLFKIMNRLGITGSKQRDPSKGNQVVTLITRTELDRIRSELRPAKRGSEQVETDVEDVGFYRRLWEKTAIDCVIANCEQIHTEVFRTDSIDEVAGRCDKFFGMMSVLSDRRNESRP